MQHTGIWGLNIKMNDMNLLLHVCCAPCMTSFEKYFKERDIEYSAFFYNPNIHPYKEYLKRYKTLEFYAEEINVSLIHKVSFQQSKWETEFADLEKGNRCEICYRTRLFTTARIAAEKGFTHFTSTLLISPYQKHELLFEIGKEAAQSYGIEFYYVDFRTLFREGQNAAREENLYRQKYCGCIYSYNESKFNDSISWQ